MDAFTNADMLSQTGGSQLMAQLNGIPSFNDGGLSATGGSGAQQANVGYIEEDIVYVNPRINKTEGG